MVTIYPIIPETWPDSGSYTVFYVVSTGRVIRSIEGAMTLALGDQKLIDDEICAIKAITLTGLQFAELRNNNLKLNPVGIPIPIGPKTYTAVKPTIGPP